MSADDLHPIDRIVGERIRARRRDLGLSQARLAEKLGVTYQQLQKYETGVNKVSGQRLQTLCQAIGVEPVFFFDLGLSCSNAGPTQATPSEDECRRLVAAFRRIETARLRQSIITMVEAVARNQQEQAPRHGPPAGAARED